MQHYHNAATCTCTRLRLDAASQIIDVANHVDALQEYVGPHLHLPLCWFRCLLRLTHAKVPAIPVLREACWTSQGQWLPVSCIVATPCLLDISYQGILLLRPRFYQAAVLAFGPTSMFVRGLLRASQLFESMLQAAPDVRKVQARVVPQEHLAAAGAAGADLPLLSQAQAQHRVGSTESKEPSGLRTSQALREDKSQTRVSSEISASLAFHCAKRQAQP